THNQITAFPVTGRAASATTKNTTHPTHTPQTPSTQPQNTHNKHTQQRLSITKQQRTLTKRDHRRQ
ncbi:hypothetical protein, partial [Corynebacterium parakroppenstedtii]|uniref:hypothetical protein n=1 Tax=Corynebacterium parakroppenstedtii TaxID=2828363 RepID=UPI001C8E5134